jgi:alanine racemase
MSRRTIATIDLCAIEKNVCLLQSLSPGSKTVAVVKADAYGNGAARVAKHIEKRVDMFAVAFFEEARQLRESGIKLPILILQGPHESRELEFTLTLDLCWMIHSEEQLSWLKRSELSPLQFEGRLWFKFDSGMHRLGFALNRFKQLKEQYSQYFTSSTVIATHLACADEAECEHTHKQIASFLEQVQTANFPLSIANSAGTMAHKQARQAFNRLGIAMYGSSPFDPTINDGTQHQLKNVVTLQAHIIALRTIPKGDTVGYGATWRAPRESVIATVAIGYADGYPRHAPTGTPAFCNKQHIRLVGRVSMDMLTFDVTELSDVKIGDVVELWGANLSINDVAQHIGTIGYELMTRLSARVPRQYIHAE